LSLLEQPQQFNTLPVLLSNNKELESLFIKLKETILRGLSPWRTHHTSNPPHRFFVKSSECNPPNQIKTNKIDNISQEFQVHFENFPERIRSRRSALNYLSYFGIDTVMLKDGVWTQRKNVWCLVVTVHSIEEALRFLQFNRRIARVDINSAMIVVKVHASM